MGIKKKSEKGFMETLRQFARARGWVMYHTLRSKGSEPGLMDCLFRRDPRWKGVCRLIVAECKLEGEEPTEEQVLWLQAFAAMGIPTYRWTPEDWDEITEAFNEP